MALASLWLAPGYSHDGQGLFFVSNACELSKIFNLSVMNNLIANDNRLARLNGAHLETKS
jgi:hypothetical protein